MTLVGFGGVGKTRLATEAVSPMRDRFAAGVALADVSACEDPDEVAIVVMSALGIEVPPRSAAPPVEYLTSSIGDKELMLVLDGCERSLPAVADVATALLTRCSALRLVTTSQQPLRLYGEWSFPVAPLPTPEPGGPHDPDAISETSSVRLFVDRARAASPGFELTERNATHIAELCHLVDGLPLAIELAASKVRCFPPPLLVSEIRSGEDVLTSGPVDIPDRHQSMRQVVAWSRELLDDESRGLLNQLSVCGDCFDLATVEAVCGLSRPAAQGLVELLTDRSLVIAREQSEGTPYFTMLRTVRAYGRAELEGSGDLAAASGRHATRFALLAARAAEGLAGAAQSSWLTALKMMGDNFPNAFGYLRANGEHDTAARAAVGLHRFWLITGRLRSGLRELDASIAALRPHDRGAESMATLAEALVAAGDLAAALAGPKAAAGRYKEALGLYETLDMRGEAAVVRCLLGRAAYRAGDRESGHRLAVRAMRVLRTIGEENLVGAAIPAAAECLLASDEVDAAAELLDDALSAKEAARNGYDRARLLAACARLAAGANRDRDARRYWLESLALFGGLGAPSPLPAELEDYAVFAEGRGRQSAGVQAVRMCATAHALRARIGGIRSVRRGKAVDATLKRLRSRLGESAYQSAWNDGLGCDPATVVEAAAQDCHDAEPTETSAEARTDLTPRQLEVARLVARGFTNRQIASHLGISEWTAVNHVRHLMHKLDCPSRVHIARLMVEAT